jgi:hypothetical protein
MSVLFCFFEMLHILHYITNMYIMEQRKLHHKNRVTKITNLPKKIKFTQKILKIVNKPLKQICHNSGYQFNSAPTSFLL